MSNSRRPGGSGPSSTTAGRSAEAQAAFAERARWRALATTLTWTWVAGMAAVAVWFLLAHPGPASSSIGLPSDQGAVRRLGAVALGILSLAASRSAWLARPIADPQRWSRGAAGEVATSTILDTLGRRWVVRHDRAIPRSHANLDHVVIGPSGVWVVDTKAYRAEVGRRGRRLLAGDHEIDVGPLIWEASVVASHLGIAVRPVVAVHARGLEGRGAMIDGVRVIPATSLPQLLRHPRRARAVRPDGSGPRRGARIHLGRSAVRGIAANFDAGFATAACQDVRSAAGSARGWRRG